MAPAIEVEGLSKRYRIGASKSGHRYRSLREEIVRWASRPRRWLQRSTPRKRREQFWALKDVSFQVEHGEVLGVIGRNGAGKSTLLKILSRITKPTGGTSRQSRTSIGVF